MPIYECSLYRRVGDVPTPVIYENRPVTREIVAPNAGKARYRWWLRLSDCDDSVRLQDIRVSLSFLPDDFRAIHHDTSGGYWMGKDEAGVKVGCTLIPWGEVERLQGLLAATLGAVSA